MIEPNGSRADIAEARLLHAAGRLAEAERHYRAALAKRPDDPDAMQLLGVAAYQRGRKQEGKAWIEKALAVAPGHFEAWVNLGTVCEGLGDLRGAAGAFERATQVNPSSATAWNYLGLALLGLGRAADAEEALLRSLSLAPEAPETLLNLANTQRAQGRNEDAASTLRRCVQAAPDYAEAHNNLGDVLLEMALARDAAAAFRRACELKPSFAPFRFNLATALQVLGELPEAIAEFRAALRVRTGYYEAALGLANALKDSGDFEGALKQFETAERLASRRSAARAGKAKLLQDLGRVHEAREHLRHADPATRPAEAFLRALALPIILESTEEIVRTRERVAAEMREIAQSDAKLLDPLREVGQTSFYLAYHRWNEIDLQRQIAQTYLRACPSLGYTAPHCLESRTRGGRIRLGIVCAFLRSHTIGKLFAPLIERLDRERVEVTLLPLPHKEDAVSRRLAERCERVVPLPGNLEVSRVKIADQKLDALFFPEIGMDPQTYYLAFSRLAPLQFTTWGHPATTGIPNMDAFLSSVDLEPEGNQAEYTERLVRLPRLGTFFERPVPRSEPLAATYFGLPDGRRLYACPQTLFKFHPDFDQALASIVARDDRALIVLISGKYPEWDHRLLARFARSSAKLAERTVFLPQMSLSDYLGLMRLADAVLDPFYFSGGNSSLEGFSVGATIVTWPTELLRARITAACYELMGFGDLVASDTESYVALALQLATDREFRSVARARILERNEVLYESTDAVRQLEGFLGAELANGQRE